MRSSACFRTTLITALAGLGVTACTGDSGSIADENEVASALELDNGGLDTADEAPEFGTPDDFAISALENDTAFDDELSADTAIADMRVAPGAVAHRVAIVWGQLPPDRTNDVPKLWTGALQLSRGGMLVRRTVGFEERTDHVIRPRTDRNTVAFESVTRPFADGLVLEVVDPTPATTDPLVLSYHGAAGDYQLDLAQLAAGPIVIDVDANGNKLVAISLRRLAADTDPCNRGFMRGRWHQLRPGLGVYIGVVADADGNPIGHVRGIYGVRADGSHSMFGKFIDRDGRFMGILAGHYRDGEFAARWLARTGDAGKIHGAYREGAPGGKVGGAWVARWAETTCAQDLPVDMP